MEILVNVLVMLLYVVAVTWAIVGAFRGTTHEEELMTFGATLEGASFRSGRVWLQRNDELTGVSASGRRVSITDRGGTLRYRVKVQGWRQEIRLKKAELLERVAERAGEQDRLMRAALNDLFGPLSFSEVLIQDGWLQVERQAFLSAYQVESIQRVFAQLEKIAPLYDGIELRLRGSTEVSIGLTGGGETARCPYCHDGIDLQGDDACACDSCSTLHHQTCLDENGECTVLGCSGSRRESSAVQA